MDNESAKVCASATCAYNRAGICHSTQPEKSTQGPYCPSYQFNRDIAIRCANSESRDEAIALAAWREREGEGK